MNLFNEEFTWICRKCDAHFPHGKACPNGHAHDAATDWIALPGPYHGFPLLTWKSMVGDITAYPVYFNQHWAIMPDAYDSRSPRLRPGCYQIVHIPTAMYLQPFRWDEDVEYDDWHRAISRMRTFVDTISAMADWAFPTPAHMTVRHRALIADTKILLLADDAGSADTALEFYR